MASPVTPRASRQFPYSGTPGVRLRRACARLPVLTLILTFGLACSGCALSYKLDSVFGKETDHKDDATGSLAQGPFAAASMTDLAEGDLVYARAAATDVLSRGGRDASAPWENPKTGARGTVTPLASAYTQDGVTCRDFLASYLRGNEQAWLQGEACLMSAGRWEVKSLKPLKRT
jgi:surface antigen